MAEPPVPEEIWEEILLRLPPDDPASLLRASLVCKQWCRIASRRGFLRRLRELHRKRPMLGFFSNTNDQHGITFRSSFSGCRTPLMAIPERLYWPRILDCRHGRALIVSWGTVSIEQHLIVWEPITGYQHRLPEPVLMASSWSYFTSAVLCAADGCDHSDCHGGPFRVVFVCTSRNGGGSLAEYSSETGMWGEPIQVGLRWLWLTTKSSILVGKALYFLCEMCRIIEYDLSGRSVMVIDPADAFAGQSSRIILVQAEDGGLGVVRLEDWCLYLWSRQRSGKDNGDSDVGWVLRRTIRLENLLPAADLSLLIMPMLIGFAEEANMVFLGTECGIFIIELNSSRVRKLLGGDSTSLLLPFVSFYTPGMQVDAWKKGLGYRLMIKEI